MHHPAAVMSLNLHLGTTLTSVSPKQKKFTDSYLPELFTPLCGSQSIRFPPGLALFFHVLSRIVSTFCSFSQVYVV